MLLGGLSNTNNTRVKYVVVEAYAVINHLVGSDALKAMLMQNNVDDNSWRTLSRRFEAHQLPCISKDGLVRLFYNHVVVKEWALLCLHVNVYQMHVHVYLHVHVYHMHAYVYLHVHVIF